MPVNTLDDLREHLQWAIELEHATIPPYLCALYSIKPGTNQPVVNAITSVFIEEMLHMTLAANLLNAVGGAPVLNKPEFLARYPTYLPHSNKAFLVPLEPFSPAAVETFMKIERPEEREARAEAEGYETIGQFYRAIEDGLKVLCETLGETQVFTGDPSRQIAPDTFEYRGSGRIVAVSDLASALAAIDEIEEQGEGLKHAEVWDGDRDMFHPERDEVAHYFRFEEILKGRSYQRGDTPASGPSGPSFDVDWSAVYPMRPNPRSQDFHGGSTIVAKLGEFNLAYSDLLRDLHRAFNGERDRLFTNRLLANLKRGFIPQIGPGTNHLSCVYAGNVASAIVAALDAPAQTGFRAYNVTRDAEPLLTQREFFATFAAALGRPARFIPVPVWLVRFGIAVWSILLKAVFPGRYAGLGGAAVSFILGENPYAIDRIRAELGWSPPFDTRTAILRSVR